MRNIGTFLTAFLSCATFGALAQSTAPAQPGAPANTPICGNYSEVMASVAYPPEAIAQGLKTGSALVEFTLSASGKVTNVRAVESSHAIFAAAAEAIVAKYQCRGQGKSVQVRVPFQWKLE